MGAVREAIDMDEACESDLWEMNIGTGVVRRAVVLRAAFGLLEFLVITRCLKPSTHRILYPKKTS